MHGNHRLANVALVALLGGLTGLWGCSDSGGITTPSASSPVPEAAPFAAVSTTALSQEVTAAMGATLQDEYHAESIYLGVLADFGDQRPFANVVKAEVRHSESILRLYGNRGLVAPASQWTVGNVPHFSSVTEACAAAASIERHLPAFQACSCQTCPAS